MKVYKSAIVFFAAAVLIVTGIVSLSCEKTFAATKKSDPAQAFYTANHDYELRQYDKALEGYNAVLASGLESGSLYYNMGNTYLKLGKFGKAILYYEKAMRLMPHDGDLKSNLAYARSLVDITGSKPESVLLKAVNIVFRPYSLRAVIFSMSVLYLMLIVLAAVSIVNPVAGKRLRVSLIAVSVFFALNLFSAIVRYHDEQVLKHGIVVVGQAECKYEPIEKSTTYYNVRDGNAVIILNTRNGWRQIKRPDGKIGWVGKDAVEEV